jgi:RNA recognition motif-containing protein
MKYSAKIDISIDPFTLRNPSYCFVDFTTSEEARTAMQTLSGIDFQGRPLKAKPCVQKRHQADRYRADVLLSNRWSNSHSQRVETRNVALTNDILAPMREHRRIYVGNLPKPLDNYTSDLELRGLFRDFDVEAVSKVLSPSEELVDRSKYYAFVDLRNAEEAAKAVKNLDGIKMWGTELVVNVASGRPRKALKAMGLQSLEE